MKQHLLSVGVFLLALFFSMSLLGRLQRKPRQSKLLTAMALADKHGGAEATGSKKGAPAAVPDAAAQAAAARKAKYAHLSVPDMSAPRGTPLLPACDWKVPLKSAQDYLASGVCPAPGAVSASLDPYRRAPAAAHGDYFGPKYVSASQRHTIVQIMGNALVTHVPKDSTGYGPIGGPRLNWFLEGLRSLLSKVRVPDAQFSLYLGDGCEAYRQRISVKPGVDDRALKSLSFDTDLGTKMLFPLVLCADRNESDTWGVWGPSRSMSEMLIRHGANHLQQVAANSTRLSPWAHKKNQAVWRGGTTGRGYTPGKWREEGRTKLANFSQRFPHLLDAGFTGFPQAGPEVVAELKKHNFSLGWNGRLKYEQQWKFKILVVVDGNSVADRLLEQLASNCVVVKQESHWKEHWHEELIPMKHYIPVKHDLSDLGDVLRKALSDDAMLQRIAKESTEFALRQLDPIRRVECYWFELITNVAQLSKHNVKARRS